MNDNDIYEGDIVKCNLFLLNDIKLFVTWCEERLSFVLTEHPYDCRRYLNFNDVKDFEVVGNIYDNPELLTF